MKTAVLILPGIPDGYDTNSYYNACISEVTNDDITLLTPKLPELARQMMNKDYIIGLESIINIIYVFTDFGSNVFVNCVISHFKERPGIEIIYKSFPAEIMDKFISNLGSILRDVADKAKVPIEELKSKSRQRDLVEARQIYFYISKNKTSASLAKIGAEVNRDHATVIHGLRTFENVRDLKEKYNLWYGPVIKLAPRKNRDKHPVVYDPSFKATPGNISDTDIIKPYSGYVPHQV